MIPADLKNPMGLICTHCERGDKPILLVAYTASDGVFQFLCGEDGHGVDDADPIHLHHVVSDDPSVACLLGIERTFEAERASINHPWTMNYDPDLD